MIVLIIVCSQTLFCLSKRLGSIIPFEPTKPFLQRKYSLNNKFVFIRGGEENTSLQGDGNRDMESYLVDCLLQRFPKTHSLFYSDYSFKSPISHLN